MPSTFFAASVSGKTTSTPTSPPSAVPVKPPPCYMGRRGPPIHAMDFSSTLHASGRGRRRPPLLEESAPCLTRRRYVRHGYDPHAATLSHPEPRCIPSKCTTGRTAAALPPYESRRHRGRFHNLLGARHRLRAPPQAEDVRKTSRRLKASTKNSPAAKSEYRRSQSRTIVSKSRPGWPSPKEKMTTQSRPCVPSPTKKIPRRRTGRHPRPRNDRRYAARSQAPAASPG